MTLSLVQLTTFGRLARERNFTRTAELLHLTQPAVSAQVRALEEHFGVKLVDLAGRRTVLTEAGHFLADRAGTLLGNVEALEREMREFADVRAGELRVGATVTIGTYALPALVARFADAHPGVVLRAEVGNTAAMALAVKAGRVSLALVEGPLDDEELEIVPYADDELILIVPPDHPFTARRVPVAPGDLAGVPLILREEGSGTRLQIERGLAAANVTPRVALALPSGEAIVRAVEVGLGVAIVSRLIAADPLRAGRVATVEQCGLDLRRTFRAVRPRRQTPSPAALALIALLNAP